MANPQAIFASDFTDADRARFWSKVVRAEGCWLWTAAQTQWGYGAFVLRRGKKRTLGAHRVSYALANGEAPASQVVCHSCDVRNCVNPSHLWTGTNDDNMADMVAKGTLKGANNPNSKLDVWDVICIRADRRSHARIARDYGMSESCIMLVKSRRNWRHVPEMEC